MFRRRRLEIAERRIGECARSGSETLDLSGLKLGEVPASIRQVRHLKNIDLRSNGLSTLPEWMAGFIQLKSLDLGWEAICAGGSVVGDAWANGFGAIRSALG